MAASFGSNCFINPRGLLLRASSLCPTNDFMIEYDIFCLSSRMGLKGLNKFIVDYFISPIFGLTAHLFRKKDSDIFIFKK